MKNELILTESQNLAVITLKPKGGDTHKLPNKRPISLMCCDYKILSKIIANRFKMVIPEVISKEQFCCPGRTKAFDRINHTFLFKSMEKMGFNRNVIDLIKLFCLNKKSCLEINGNILVAFNIGRGIRQGCPLSMLIYVIFKEALYKYIKSCSTIKSLPLPNDNIIKISGDADDTSLFTRCCCLV